MIAKREIVKTGNISMFGPTFCCKEVASRAIEVAKEWLSYNGLVPKDVRAGIQDLENNGLIER